MMALSGGLDRAWAQLDAGLHASEQLWRPQPFKLVADRVAPPHHLSLIHI